MITLVEFLKPIKAKPNRDKCLAVLYYNERYKDIPGLASDQVRTALGQARIPNAKNINVADVLAKSGHYVDAPANDDRGRKLWGLTEAGRQYVRALLGLPEDQPEIEQDVSSLRAISAGITDPIVKGFVDEAITCLSVQAIKAAIVFLWSGAIRTLQERMLAAHSGVDVTAAIVKHDARSRGAKKIEDFAAVNDKLTLLAARELTVIDKGQWTILQGDLDVRNQCGHPTKFNPGPKKASSIIEDLVNNVF
ncbi:MAG TPA: hypothetical protein VNU19_16760 [Candidatus Acidoferrum sp.]|nr:hypothetical protein [Candidatus Acidoferrum sp.]